MPFFKRLAQTTVIGAGATLGSFFFLTRNSKFDSSFGPSPADSVFGLPIYSKHNPSKNPTTHDYCVRRVPLSKIKPGLLADEDGLTTEFCRGVWSGLGMFNGAFLVLPFEAGWFEGGVAVLLSSLSHASQI